MVKERGYSDVLIGLQYGDEGKGRWIDTIANNYGIIARFNGGPNAGHVIEDEKKGRIALHSIPSGIFYPEKLLYIGSGCVVDPLKLVKEIEDIREKEVSLEGRLHISAQASLIQPHHVLIDGLIGGTIGTTKSGIGSAYSDRALRMNKDRMLNLRLSDLKSDFDGTIKDVERNLEAVAKDYSFKNLDIKNIICVYESIAYGILKYVQDDPLFLSKHAENGTNVLFEGAQSFMLDVVKGSVPYVTSSNTIAAAAYIGGDLSLGYHRKTFGVAKAIMSRVGNGPFTSEFGGVKSEEYCMEEGGNVHNKNFENKLNIEEMLGSSNEFDVGRALRILGNEYGSTTRRPRRIGALDLVQLEYGVKVNGVDELFLNKCDSLKDFARTAKGKIPIVSGYSLNGKKIDYLPVNNDQYRKVQPVIEGLPVFDKDISYARSVEELPKELIQFLSYVEEKSCKIKGIGVGPKRGQYILC